MLSTEERIRRLVEAVEESLRKDEASDQTMRAMTDRRLDVLVHKCGYKKRSGELLQRLQHAFVSQGIYPQPELNQDSLGWKQTIYFSRNPPPPVPPDRPLFSQEYGLKRYLLDNYRFVDELRDLVPVKTEFELSSGEKTDLLFREPDSGDYVVVELKFKDPGQRILAQVINYLNAVERVARKSGNKVRGIIITGEPNAALEGYLRTLAKKDGHRIDWFVYRLDMSLERVGGTEPS